MLGAILSLENLFPLNKTKQEQNPYFSQRVRRMICFVVGCTEDEAIRMLEDKIAKGLVAERTAIETEIKINALRAEGIHPDGEWWSM